MIKSFKDKKTAQFFEGKDVKEYRNFANQLTRRLAVLNDAEKQQDLTELRSNRFEMLSGDRKGQCSIRIKKTMAALFSLGL